MKLVYLTLYLMLFVPNLLQAQSLTAMEWSYKSKMNKRLLPKYGHLPKNEKEKASDKKFVEAIMSSKQFGGDSTMASNHLINLGFTYLYQGNHTTAMYRFNQAYLIDSNNVEIYWGFAAFFSYIGAGAYGKTQLEKGLAIDSNNVHMLTDLGTYYLGHYYYYTENPNEEKAKENIELALSYMEKAYAQDSTYPAAVIKMSICNWAMGNCALAWKYYWESEDLGGELVTKGYTKDLKLRCKKVKKQKAK
jgi:tetratricopeptide (TPR) repeat protein